MLVLGVDPSLNGTAWALIESHSDGKIVLLDKNTLKLKAGGDYLDKIGLIVEMIDNVIKKYNLNIIAIEETIVNKNALSSLKLGMVRGACVAIAKINNIAIEQYKPNTIKSVISGYGHADKIQIVTMIKSTLSNIVEFSTYDESDAAAIAIAHIVLSNSSLYQAIK